MNLRDWSWYHGNLEWLRARTIFLTKAGSHAYGTNTPTSDIDLRGIAIPPKEYFLGQLHRFEQAETKGDPDVVVTDIRKFVKLASDCNPNVIELLFTDPSDWLTPDFDELQASGALTIGGLKGAWYRLYANRHLFLSKKAKFTFSGYAIAQLKRIQTHRGWLLNQPKKKPERSDFGLPDAPTLAKEQFGVIEAKIRKVEDTAGGLGWTKDQVEGVDEALVAAVAQEADLHPNLIPLIVAERKYNAACRQWASFVKWQEERNETRSELEKKFGYDTKHGMHLVRLMRMAREILDLGEVRVKRPDAEELLTIRRGAWDYCDLIAWARNEEVALNESYEASKLPHGADVKKIDELLVSIVGDTL